MRLKNRAETTPNVIWEYTSSEYFYMMTDGSLTLNYKTYTINSLDDAVQAWKELKLNAGFGI